MVDAQVTHATMEVSSHALAWYRTVGCDFDTVVLTNITEDHLDFHQTFEHYLGSKSKLFAWLGSLPVKRKRLRRAVLNGDDPHWQPWRSKHRQNLLYGLSDHCHVRAANIRVTRDGVSYHLEHRQGQRFRSKNDGIVLGYNSFNIRCFNGRRL